MNWKNIIVSDKKVLLGKPIISGTRISVEFLLERLADGWSEEMILENYPQLNQKHLQAVFSYLNDFAKDGLMVEIQDKTV